LQLRSIHLPKIVTNFRTSQYLAVKT